MRVLLDLALFGAVFAIAFSLFHSALYAALAAIIIVGAGDGLVWSEPPATRTKKKPR